MKTSQTISKISVALLKAQSAIGSAKKDAQNPFFRSSYATLGSVIEVCKEELNKNGISVLQPVEADKVTTILLHESGEWISDEGVIILCAKPNDPQAQGGAITYSRRQGLTSLLLIPSVDDDGESATDHDEPATMYEINSVIDLLNKLPDTQAKTDSLELFNSAKAGKRPMTKQYMLGIKSKVKARLAELGDL